MTSEIKEEKTELFSSGEITEAIHRMAEAICREFLSGPQKEEDFYLVGLYQEGVPLAELLQQEIQKLGNYLPTVAKLDISMYRDDVGQRTALPIIKETVMPFAVERARVILVDDVLSSGRTIRAALDALTDYGRPALIRLAVLVDRGASEYPIRADYAGFQVSIPGDRKVVVEFDDTGKGQVGEIPWRKRFNR